MKSLLALTLTLISTSTFANSDNSFTTNPQMIICSNLLAAQSISELEVQSYAVRGYDSITSTYMRLALGKVRSHLLSVTSQSSLVQSYFADSLVEGLNYELNDSYNYSGYKPTTASRIFSKLSSDLNSLQSANDCL